MRRTQPALLTRRLGRSACAVLSGLCAGALGPGAGSPMLATALALGVSGAHAAQPADATEPPDTALEEYLQERGLRDLLVAHLLSRLRTSEGAQRAELAERIGSHYVRMLDEATTPEQRRQWERRAIELLEAVPEAESIELRLTLARARYLQAEEIAERHRMRLAEPEEINEAEALLRSLGAQLQDMGRTLNRRVDQLERREAAARDVDARRIRTELTEARRLRSLSMYYGGWANYYAGMLSGRRELAGAALMQFGWILNAPGREANVERISEGMLEFEHVARAAIGCALSESLRGRDGPALLWLHALETAGSIPESVREQLLARRMVILTAAKRWADLQQAVTRTRGGSDNDDVNHLRTADARLLAVLMLEALKDDQVDQRAHGVISDLASMAIGDLVQHGEARHVHDLVSRFGTALLSGEGFIVQYVRGLHAYENARAAHADGEDDQEPSARAEVANLYAAAGQLFDLSIAANDADRFTAQRASAAMFSALSLYYGGRLEQAAARFEEAYRLASRNDPPAGAEDALWMAVVALDKAVVQGRGSLEERLHGIATLYLQKFPSGDRAAMLILRLSDSGIIARERAVEILLGIDRRSPLYETARQHAADLLYAMFRRARGGERDFAALRFAEVADELLSTGMRAVDSRTDEGREAGHRVLLRLRQVLDAALSMSAPDLDRAEQALRQVRTVAQRGDLDLAGVEDEIIFRELQVALRRQNQRAAEDALERLHALGGRFADAADRLLYQQAVEHYHRRRTPENAAVVVRHGERIITQFGTDRSSLQDPAVQSLYNAVATAAAHVWESRGDLTHRRTALRLDARIISATGERTPAVILRRFARLSEASGEAEAALDAWRTLLAGLPGGSQEWYEARYESLRLLAQDDPARARQVFEQFKVLHPTLGPEPWPARFGELQRMLDGASDVEDDGEAMRDEAASGEHAPPEGPGVP